MAMKRPLLGQAASLRVRLMALALVSIAPGLLVIAFMSHQISSLRRAEVADLATRSAQQTAGEIDRIIAGVESLLSAVASIPIVRRMEEGPCRDYLGTVVPNMPHLAAAFIARLDGTAWCHSFPAPEDFHVEDRAYFIQALRSQEVIIGTRTVDRATGRSVLPLALATRDPTGGATGVIVAMLDLDWFGAWLRERGAPTGGSITVADRDRVILARHPLAERFVGTRIPESFSRLMLAPMSGAEEVTSQDGTVRMLGYVPLELPPRGLYISAGLSSEASFYAVDSTARTGGLLILAGALAALAATWLVGSRFFIRPLERLTKVLARWRSGERDARTMLTTEEGEIGSLGAELDALMDEIASGQAQRDLLAREMAHRVKNTLATVQALAQSTLNVPTPAREALPAYLARIAALGRAHDILLEERWESASLVSVLDAVLQPLCPDGGGRCPWRGPTAFWPPTMRSA